MKRVPLLLLLLLLPAAHAGAESWHGALVGPSVAADAQVLEATVVAIRIPLPQDPETSAWSLEGAHLEAFTRVEVTDRRRTPDPADPTAVLDPSVHEERGVHADFVARVARAGAGTLYVLPHPDGAATLERSLGVVDLVPSGDGTLWPGDGASRHQRPHDTSRTVLVRDKEPPLQYVVHGDLLLDVSSMDWIVEDREGSTRYASGGSSEPAVSEAPDGVLPPGREERRHLFLYVRDGTLRLPGHGIQPDLYLDGVRVESGHTGSHAASGVLEAGAVRLELAGDAVEFRGRNRLTGLHSTGRLLAYDVEAEGALHVDGVRVDPADPLGPAAAARDGPGAAALAWLLLPPLAIVLARPPFWLVAAALRMRLRRFAARHAPRFLASPRAPQAALVGAVALLGLRRFRQARWFLDRVPVVARPMEGTWSYLQAHACAGVGADGEAADHLERCLEGAPEHAPQVLANPVLRRVVAGHPSRFGRLLPLRRPQQEGTCQVGPDV